MKYLGQHIKTIIATYNGSIPLAHFLKGYFRQYPILGSRDRKILSTLAYTYYRIGKGTDNKDWPDTLMAQMLKGKRKTTLILSLTAPRVKERHSLHQRVR